MGAGEKRYIGNAMRWGLFVLIFVTVTAMLFVGKYVPDNEVLRYSEGKFFTEHSIEKYLGILMIPVIAAAVLAVASVVYELFTRQRLADKIARIAVTVLLGAAGCVGFAVGTLSIVGLPFDMAPDGAEEYEAYGHTFVLCRDPDGLHHSHPAIYEIVDGEPVSLWEGGAEYMDSSISEGFHIEPAEGGWLVTYTETKGDISEKKSLIIGREEGTP